MGAEQKASAHIGALRTPSVQSAEYLERKGDKMMGKVIEKVTK